MWYLNIVINSQDPNCWCDEGLETKQMIQVIPVTGPVTHFSPAK